MARSFQHSPLALAILALLYESPMHPYRMQQLIKERGKDKVVNVQRRTSLYQTISQLQRAGLVTVRETRKADNRPERTIYALTDNGYQAVLDWLREILSTPASEFPAFPAAISFLPLLTPDDALHQLELREAALAKNVAELAAELRTGAGGLPRLFLLEDELLHVTLEAELTWVRALIADLRAGQITWNEAWIRSFISTDTEE